MEKSSSAATRPFHPVPTTNSSEGLNKRETSDHTFATFCTLSDCDPSDIISSPKYQCRTARGLGASTNRSSVCSLLSTSSTLCGLDIVHEKSSSVEFDDKVPVLLPSESTEFMASLYKPIQRSDFSMNSLGLSVDSSEAGGGGRDLFTPPVGIMNMRNGKVMLSPPPLVKRGSASPLPFEGWKR